MGERGGGGGLGFLRSRSRSCANLFWRVVSSLPLHRSPFPLSLAPRRWIRLAVFLAFRPQPAQSFHADFRVWVPGLCELRSPSSPRSRCAAIWATRALVSPATKRLQETLICFLVGLLRGRCALALTERQAQATNGGPGKTCHVLLPRPACWRARGAHDVQLGGHVFDVAQSATPVLARSGLMTLALRHWTRRTCRRWLPSGLCQLRCRQCALLFRRARAPPR